MRAGHLRDEFREQVHFGLRPLDELIAGKHEFLKHQLLRAEHEVGGTLIGLGDLGFSYGRCLLWAVSESSGMDMMTSGLSS